MRVHKGSSGLEGGGRAGKSQTMQGSREEKTFSDRAMNDSLYRGDGRDSKQWFRNNSNVDELISQMGYKERDAFTHWTEGDYMYGQQWGEWDDMDKKSQTETQIFDNILDQTRVDNNVMVARLSTAELIFGAGVKTTTLDALRAMEGETAYARGSMSFAAAAEGLTIGDTSKQVEYHLHIPGGSKGVGMWIGDDRINPWFGNTQREFMTNRNAQYKIGKTVYDANRGVFIVDLTFKGIVKHDYGHKGK